METRPFFVGVMLVVAACAGGAGPTATSTVPSVTVATTIPPPISTATSTSAPTTTSAATPEPSPRYLRFDDSGMYLVDGEGVTHLSAETVTTASHDGMGGVLFTVRTDAWANGLHWIRSGAGKSETLNYLRGWGAVIQGRPSAVVQRDFWSEECPETEEPVYRIDLQTGEETRIGCFGGEDGGVTLSSGGGALMVGTSWIAVGANGSSQQIHFYDMAGTEIAHPANPVPASCAPCELSARLSPDGTHLAYGLRPDAKWSPDIAEHQRLDHLTYDQWWEETKHVDVTVAVVDLETGAERFIRSFDAGRRLTDFDGRYLVVEHCELSEVPGGGSEVTCESSIVDTHGVAADLDVPGRARLVTRTWTDPPAEDVFPPLLRVWSPWQDQVVETRTFRFSGVADPEAAVVAAGRYPVTIEADGEWSIVLVLNPGGNLATITATDAAGNTTTVRRAVLYRPPVEVGEHGLSVAAFGEPMDESIAVLAEILGPPDRPGEGDALECYPRIEEVRFVDWERFGLRLVFTDRAGSDSDPVRVPLQFAAWELTGPGVVTDRGVGWGSTVDELRDAYPGVLMGINEWAPEFSVPTSGGWIRGGFDWPYRDFLASMQRALNDRGADLQVTGAWDAPTTAAVLAFMEQGGIEQIAVLSALGLPPDDVPITWLNSGPGPPCV